MQFLIKNVSVVNADGITPDVDIQIKDGQVQAIGKNLAEKGEVLDGTGLHAFPGFIDLHSHLRDPGLTHKEDIVTGTSSAAAGGFTAVCCMPNTQPEIDSAKVVREILNRAADEGVVQVLPVAAITKGLKGKKLTNFKALQKAGAVAFSDDGMPVQDDEMILAAMAQAKELDALLMLHEEDLKKRGKGVANDGENAQKAGLVGIPREIEDSMTARDIFYAQKQDARIHICHVSTVGSVELVRRAKRNGVKVTCETTPHYFSLTDEAVVDKNPNAKVNPPLRTEADRQAVIAGLMDGTIDAIATDHAPHTEEEKAVGFEKAPFGLIGFETAFSLVVTHLLRTGKLELQAIARLLSAQPAQILRCEGGALKPGVRADIALCDIEKEYTYTKEMIVSKSKNSPFLGQDLFGKVVYTISGGNFAYGK